MKGQCFNKERIRDLKDKWEQYNMDRDSKKDSIPEELYEIIKKRIYEQKRYFHQDGNIEYCGLCMEDVYCQHEIKLEEIKEIALKLADLFERESRRSIRWWKKYGKGSMPNDIDFNPKEFLKLAGVE